MTKIIMNKIAEHTRKCETGQTDL